VGTLGGLLLILTIAVGAGSIAYVGDRVGHQVGRKRLTLFGLRPKYTSTLVAMGTGVMIALVATGVVLLTTPLARDAFFHLSEINDKVNELQAQADQLEKQTHESNVVINRGQLLYNQFLVITPQESYADRRKRLAEFFEAVVASLNRTYAHSGLKPFTGKSTDPDIAKKLDAVLNDPRVQGFLLTGPVLLVAVADENLFPNDRISFTVAAYLDKEIFAAGQSLSSVEVDGGTAIVPNVAYAQLAGEVGEGAIGLGMPAYFSNLVPALTAEQFFRRTREEVRTGRGHFYIIARAASDVYPHTGGIPVTFALSRNPK
jgi:hypothetical protein